MVGTLVRNGPETVIIPVFRIAKWQKHLCDGLVVLPGALEGSCVYIRFLQEQGTRLPV